MRLNKYKVWNPKHGTIKDTKVFEAERPWQAAEEFAENDSDGNAEGIYWNSEVILYVMDESGSLHKISVEAETSYTSHVIDD